MLLNVIVLLLIILITLYLSTQGMLSSLLALATSIFSSVLAMGLLELSQGPIASWRIDHARGITFLGLFVVIFAVTRFAADFAVPKNIKVPSWVNRLVGGVVGFFAALVVMGTTIIGVEMLPLPSSILGHDRFPPDRGMKGDTPGVAGKMNGIWFGPDRFVLGIWNMTSGRALGGNKTWQSVHPDITVESYGYRYIVARGSQRSVHPTLFKVADESWSTADSKELQPLGIPTDPGQRIVMVRTKIEKGDTPPRLTADVGSEPYFRASAGQIRLVAEDETRHKFRQYFPIGYLEFGKRFVPMPLDTGHVVDDYQNSMVINDWVFQIPDDEKPRMVEVKQFGRDDLMSIKDKPAPALAAALYPQHGYLKDLATVRVTIALKEKKLVDGKVYVIKSGVKHRDAKSEIFSAGERVVNIRSSINTGSGGWTLPKPGVPGKPEFFSAASESSNLTNSEDEAVLPWTSVLKLLLLAQAEPDGDRNYRILPEYFEGKLIPMLRNGREGSAILDSAAIPEATPSVELNRVMPGNKTILVTLRTKTSFVVWLVTSDFSAKETVTLNFNGDDPASGSNVPLLKIDLEEKVPPTP